MFIILYCHKLKYESYTVIRKDKPSTTITKLVKIIAIKIFRILSHAFQFNIIFWKSSCHEKLVMRNKARLFVTHFPV